MKIRAASNLHKECISIIDGLNLPRGAMVLGLGAREGVFSSRLIDRKFDVRAVELVPSKFQLPIQCYNLDLNSNFHDKFNDRYDLIVAIEIIEHLQNPRHFIRECLNLLKENGYLLVTSPNLESWISRIRFVRDGRPLWLQGLPTLHIKTNSGSKAFYHNSMAIFIYLFLSLIYPFIVRFSSCRTFHACTN